MDSSTRSERLWGCLFALASIAGVVCVGYLFDEKSTYGGLAGLCLGTLSGAIGLFLLSPTEPEVIIFDGAQARLTCTGGALIGAVGGLVAGLLSGGARHTALVVTAVVWALFTLLHGIMAYIRNC
jgi:hypothetical protein